jgi:hypothetical protein
MKNRAKEIIGCVLTVEKVVWRGGAGLYAFTLP